MNHNHVGLAAVACLSLAFGCSTVSTPSRGGNRGSSTAAIVARIATPANTAARLVNAQTGGCPVVQVNVNGAPVSVQFDDTCAFVIDDVQPAPTVTVRVALVDLGVAGAI